MNPPPADPRIPTIDDYAESASRLALRLPPLATARPPHQPLVSIVTVCRNAAATVPDTVASVRAQTYPWIEHLVIDGASTDGTQALLERFAAHIGWISEPDLGISDAFNKGIASARGSLIGILNADDQYLPDTVAKAVDALHQHPEADFAFGGCDFTLDGRVVLHHDGDADYAKTIHRQMPRLNHPSIFVRREIYERFGLFRLELRLAMDYDLLLRFHRHGVSGIAVPHTQVRMALGGASCQRILEAIAEATNVSRNHGEPAWRTAWTRARLSLVPFLRITATRLGLRAAWLAIRPRATTGRGPGNSDSCKKKTT
jgi:glycosyltransferase involved in cell wall biosynthesis